MTIWAAVNEFIDDYLDRHGHNGATRDEAHARIRVLENITAKTAAFCKSLDMVDDQSFDIAMIASETHGNDDAERALIVALLDEETGR